VKRIADFWAKFAEVEQLEGEIRILGNKNLPMLEVNAAYTETMADFPVLLSPARLEPHGFILEREFTLLEVKPFELNPEIWIEQVPWSRGATLAAVWCAQNDALRWQTEVSQELARILETNRDLLAYLAFEGDTATGMMVVSSTGFCGLWAGSDEVAIAMFKRGANDFGSLEVTVPVNRLESLRLAEFCTLEQYRVWISAAAL
jgi:hypothetical protein